MGIYDREYYRDETEGARHGGSWSAVGTIIVLNVAVYLATQLFLDGAFVDRWFSLPGDLFAPEKARELVSEGQTTYAFARIITLVTYGFAHATPLHIALNMLMLWMFGSDIEGI